MDFKARVGIHLAGTHAEILNEPDAGVHFNTHIKEGGVTHYVLVCVQECNPECNSTAVLVTKMEFR